MRSKNAAPIDPAYPDELTEPGKFPVLVPPCEPIFDYVLVKRIEEKDERKPGSLIHIPETAKGKPQQAVVISVGPGGYGVSGALLPMHVKRGDRVLVSKFAGHDIELDGQMYLLIAQRDVLGILRAGVVVG